MGEMHRLVAFHTPSNGDLARTQAYAWTGIEPATFWFTGQHSNLLSHTSQGYIIYCMFDCNDMYKFFNYRFL